MYVEPVWCHRNNASPACQIKVISKIAQPLHNEAVCGCSFFYIITEKSVIMSEGFLVDVSIVWLRLILYYLTWAKVSQDELIVEACSSVCQTSTISNFLIIRTCIKSQSSSTFTYYKLHRNDPWVVPFQRFPFHAEFWLLSQPRGKTLKIFSSKTTSLIIVCHKWSLLDPLSSFSD